MPSKKKKGTSKNARPAAPAVQQDTVGMEKPSHRKRKNGVPDAGRTESQMQQCSKMQSSRRLIGLVWG